MLHEEIRVELLASCKVDGALRTAVAAGEPIVHAVLRWHAPGEQSLTLFAHGNTRTRFCDVRGSSRPTRRLLRAICCRGYLLPERVDTLINAARDTIA